MPQTTFDILSIAERYLAAGLSILPIAAGSKRPDDQLLPKVWDEKQEKTVPTWKPFQERRAQPVEARRWFRDRQNVGIGIIGGTISGGLVIIDIESVEAYDAWREHAIALLGAELVATLPVVATGKGRHIYLRMTTPIGNRKLATIGKSVLAETRGEGGYVLAPPTIHPSGAIYTLLSGDLGAIPLLTDAQAHAALDAARALTPATPHPAGVGGEGTGGSVIDAFNAAHTIESVLESHGYLPRGRGFYIRPGGDHGSVGIRDGRSRHFNTNDPLYREAPGGGIYSHSAFSAWCLLEHTGDVKAAVKAAAAKLGLSKPPSDTAQLLGQAGRALGLGQEAGGDDYKAKNVKEKDVTFLLQNYGDNMARGRLDAEANVKSAYPIRGVLISSGEDQPEGEASTLARILTVDMARGAVHRGKLTTIQNQSAYLHTLTIAYLQWLAGRDETATVRELQLTPC